MFISSDLFASKIKLSTGEWFPYTTNQENFQGIISEIVSATLKLEGVETELVFLNFDKAYKDTLDKKYKGTFPYFKTPQREKKMLYSNSLFTVENVLFYNKDRYNKNKNIKEQKIGIVDGYAYKNINIEQFKNIITIPNELVAFDMLHKGEITLLPANKLVGINIIKKYFNDFYSNVSIIKDKQFRTKDSLYLIVPTNKQNEQFLKIFNSSLEKLKHIGIYKKIILENRSLIDTSLSSVVKLVNNVDAFPMVVGTDTIDSKQKYIIPRGTKAIVLKWSKHFKQKGLLKIYDEMFKKTKVKIVNGPLKGKILYIENMFIEID